MPVNVSPSPFVVGMADSVTAGAASSVVIDSREIICLCAASLFTDGPLRGLYVFLHLRFGLSGGSSSKPSFYDNRFKTILKSGRFFLWL